MPTRSCGCGSAACNCVVRGEGGIEVSGNGTATNPYVISVSDFPLTGRLQVVDTDTIDLFLEGSGTLADPWILRAETSLALGDLTDVDDSNQTPGYVLARQPDGTFALQPAPTAAPGAIMTDSSIDGDGSAGDVLRVHDYDRIAWLSPGADNLPNEGDLILGDDTSTVGYQFISRAGLAFGGNAEAVFRVHQRNPGPGSNWKPDARITVDSRTTTETYQYSHLLNGQKINFVRNSAGNTKTWPDPWIQWATRQCLNGNGTNTASMTVTFPADLFTDTPIVTATLNNTLTSSGHYAIRIQELSETECTVIMQRVDGGTFSGLHCIGIQATQMNPNGPWE